MGNPLDKFISFETLKTLSGSSIPGSFAGSDHDKNSGLFPDSIHEGCGARISWHGSSRRAWNYICAM